MCFNKWEEMGGHEEREDNEENGMVRSCDHGLEAVPGSEDGIGNSCTWEPPADKGTMILAFVEFMR